MCLPVNAKERQEQQQQQQQQQTGEESEDAVAAKTYEDLQTTLNLLEVVICLNIRRYLQTGRGADEDEDEDGGWRIGPDGLALLANCPELQVPYFSPPGADDDDDEEDGDDDD